MKRLLLAVLLLLALFSTVTLEQWFLMPPSVRAQTNTFCANNLACTVTGAWVFSSSLTTANVLPSGTGSHVGSPTQPYLDLTIGPLITQTMTLAAANVTANRTAQFTDASGALSLANIEYCGATSGATQACAKTVQTLPIIVWGDVLLNAATSQSITTLPFTDALYSCTGSDLTTPAGVVSFNTYAAASVTIQESGGANTDHLRYQCTGH